MTTSGVITVSDTKFSIIKDALIDIGVCDHAADPDPHSYAIAARALNRMLKTWQSLGAGLAYEEEGTLSLTSAQGTYTFGGSGSPDVAFRPVRILDARLKYSDGRELPLMKIARKDYNAYPNKTTAGTPTSFTYWPGIDQGKLHLWPVPNEVGLSLNYSYQRGIETLVNNADDADVPQEALDAVVQSVGFRVYRTFFPSDIQGARERKRDAEEAVSLAFIFDREDESIFFEVDRGGR